MSRTLRTATVCVVALCASSGCASLSQHECLTADWESIGYQDGSEGHPSGRLARHAEACKEHGITPDAEQYEAGRKLGLEQMFCTAANGARVGRDRADYSGECSPESEPYFLRGFELGRHMREIDQQMKQLQYEIERLQLALRRKDPTLTVYDRDHLLYRMRELEREFGRLQLQLQLLEEQARQL